MKEDPRDQRATLYPWRDLIEKAIDDPGRMVKAGSAVPRSLISSCREIAGHTNTLLDSGRVRVIQRGEHRNDEGRLAADLYVVYEVG